MKKKKKKKELLSFRLNAVFFIVFLLFSVVILRLGIVQIVYGNDFKREVERKEDVTVQYPVPRGKMFDRNGKVIVDNTPLNAITYTRYRKTKTEEVLAVSKKLAQLIEIDEKVIDKIPVRDKKDFWIINNPKKAAKKVTKKEEEELSNEKIYKLQLERITEKEYNSFSKKELEILAIFRVANSGYALNPQIIKNEGVTAEEMARVSENLENLPGVNTTTDWKRNYPNEDLLKSVLGKVTTSEEGIPLERKNYYISRDYNQNDRVGKSYIEMQYEDVLTGQKKKVKNITNKAGDIISTKVVSEGQSGMDLMLAIDIDLQKQVEDIIVEQLLAKKQMAGTYLLDRAYVVLMDPNTGEILTMAGKRIVNDPKTGESYIQDDALGNITTSYNVGSAVKGATVLTGYQTGAIEPKTRLLDSPLYIAQTPVKKSWSSALHGYMDDVTALKRSSNVYMFRTAIEIGKGKYVPHGPLPLDLKAFDTIRNSFVQFGLGVRTGIDLPNETIGYKGPTRKEDTGKILDIVIGQYDTYSNMQLAQYVSTIANGGKRLKPHIVKSIHEPVLENNQLGPISTEITPTILNRLPMKEEWIDRVKEGFRQVMQEPQGTAVSFFGTKPYLPAGKTGTAEAFYDGPKRAEFDEPPKTINLTLVGYAPYYNPEIAMAILVPWAYQGGTGHYMNNQIGAAVLDAYFNLKETRQTQAQAQAQATTSIIGATLH